MADAKLLSPEQNVEMVMQHEQVQKLLGMLTDRERQVITLRFGLEDDQPRTLEEVGQILHVTREHIRQIESKALRKLSRRSMSRRIKIMDLLL